MIFLGLEIAPNHPSSLHYKLSYCQPELVMTMPTIGRLWSMQQFSINRQCNFQTSGKERWTNFFPILFIHSLVPALSFILFIHPPSPFIAPHCILCHMANCPDQTNQSFVEQLCRCIAIVVDDVCQRRFFASFPTSSIGLRRHICMIWMLNTFM